MKTNKSKKRAVFDNLHHRLLFTLLLLLKLQKEEKKGKNYVVAGMGQEAGGAFCCEAVKLKKTQISFYIFKCYK